MHRNPAPALCDWREALYDTADPETGTSGSGLCDAPADRGSELLDGRNLCRYHALRVIAETLLTAAEVAALFRVSSKTVTKVGERWQARKHSHARRRAPFQRGRGAAPVQRGRGMSVHKIQGGASRARRDGSPHTGNRPATKAQVRKIRALGFAGDLEGFTKLDASDLIAHLLRKRKEARKR